MKEAYEIENIKKAVRTSYVTLVGYAAHSFPMESGNCFSVIAEDGKEYSVVNFNYENLKELLKREELEWPIDVLPISENHCVIADHRIPIGWYSAKFCETCTPRHLLTPQQKLQRMLDLKSGKRIERKTVVDGIEYVITSVKSDLPEGIVFMPNTTSNESKTEFIPSDELKSKYKDRKINSKYYGTIMPFDASKAADSE